MNALSRLRAFIARQTNGLGSLLSAGVIVLAVLAFAVYSASAGSSEDRLRRAADDVVKNAAIALAASGHASQLYLNADGLNKPVSYLAEIRVNGWKNRDQCVIDARVNALQSMEGGIIHATAKSNGSAADAIAEQLTGRRVLVSVDPRIADVMPQGGDAKVRLIVSPKGQSATLVIDEVLEPILAKAGDVVVTADTITGTRSSGTAASGTNSPTASKKAPHIVSLSTRQAGPGKTVAITGTNFGAAKRGSRVTCGGVTAQVLTWSATRITFKVPSGLTRYVYVGVIVNSVASNGVFFSPFDAPVVSTISPRQGAPGSVVTITGRNFGAEQIGWVTFAGSTAPIVRWSDTVIQVLVPRGVWAGYAGVIAHDMTSNGILYAPYGAPLVTSVSKRIVGPGDTVTLRGSDFGAPGIVALGGALITASSWSPTAVTFTVPDSVHSGYVGVVLKSGVTSNGVWVSVAPKMQSLSCWWAAPGSTLTLHGRGFGSQGAYAVYVGGSPAQVAAWSPTDITVRIPSGASSGYVGVGTPAACSNGIYLLIEYPGVVASVTPRSVHPGDQITVTGSGFGASQDGRHVLIGGTQCTTISWSGGAIVAVVPPASHSGYVGIGRNNVTSNGVWVDVLP